MTNPKQKHQQKYKMAEAAAAVRAAHRIFDRPVIFDDPYAIDLTSRGWRGIVRSKWLYSIISQKLLKNLRPIQAQVISRSIYSEEKLLQAVSRNITQYVNLGAGFDTFALRQPKTEYPIQIFEIDHPITQAKKQQRISQLKLTQPHNLTYLPIDFEKESIAEVLERSDFDPNRPAFIAWLGTVPYLTESTVFNTLTDISSFMISNSEIVFDYANTHITPEDVETVNAVKKFAARFGEPLITQFDSIQLDKLLTPLGFEIIENISDLEWRDRVLGKTQNNDFRPLSTAYYAHLRVASH